MSRSVSVRITPGSALDRLLNGPQGAQLGHTRRLHDIAERYERILREASEGEDLPTYYEARATWDQERTEAVRCAAAPPRNPRSRKPARLP